MRYADDESAGVPVFTEHDMPAVPAVPGLAAGSDSRRERLDDCVVEQQTGTTIDGA